MREIKVAVRIDEKKNLIGTFEDLSKVGIPDGIDKILFMIGLYEHLKNKHLKELKYQAGFKVPKK